jgi:hypothetical protein
LGERAVSGQQKELLESSNCDPSSDHRAGEMVEIITCSRALEEMKV